MKETMKDVFDLCMGETSRDPIAILEKLMDLPSCRMHGPEHHVLVGAALLTAYRNAGGKTELETALQTHCQRACAVPGAACGFWGACGACISTGQVLSVVTGSGPLTEAQWGLCQKMTAKALNAVAEVGGPRCCKRDSYLAVLHAVDFIRENLDITMEKTVPVCSRSAGNAQCIGSRCPFYGGNK